MDHTLEYNGETLTLSEWSAKTGLPYSVLYARIRLGWDACAILTTPLRKPVRLPYKDRLVTVGEMSRLTGLRRSTIYSRLRQGKQGGALTLPKTADRKQPTANTEAFRHWLFNAIVRYKQAHDGNAPALTDLQAAAQDDYGGISIGSIKWGLSELRQEGRIDYEHNQPRSIRIVGGEWRYAAPDRAVDLATAD